MKRYVNLINTGILGLLLLIPSYASALNVGTDWTNTDKNLNTTGSITGDDITATGKITPSAEGVLYNQGGNNAVDTTIETKLSTQVVNISDWASLTTAITDISTDPISLVCNSIVTIPDGTSPTLLSNVTLEIKQGCNIKGVVGGGIETLVFNNAEVVSPDNVEWIGTDLVVTGLSGRVNTHWFSTSDTGAKINTALDASNNGVTIVVNPLDWFDKSYSTPIELIGTTATVEFPGVGDGTASYKAHYTGPDYAMWIGRSRMLVRGGFSIDFTGNGNTDVDGLVLTGSDSIVNDFISIAGALRYGIFVGSSTVAPYGNTFTGVVRISNSESDAIRFQNTGGGNPNTNTFSGRTVISNTLAAFPPESCTISQAAGVATVVHASHPYVEGDTVYISGAGDATYNGAHIVQSVLTDGSYTFTIDSTTASPATGTITATKLRVGVAFVDGYSNSFNSAYVQISAGNSFAVSADSGNPNTFNILNSETVNSILADTGTVQVGGGENFGLDPVNLNGGSTGNVDAAKNRAYFSMPYILMPQPAHHAYLESATTPGIYVTDGTGATAPFDEAGNIVIESTSIVTGGTTSKEWIVNFESDGGVRLRSSKSGAGVLVFEYQGSPIGSLTATPGSLSLNSLTTTGTYPMYIKRDTGTAGWQGLGTVYP